MAVTGSGKFVAIAASDTQFDDLMSVPISGIVFGRNNLPYCKIQSRYITSESDVTQVTGTALCINPRVDPTGVGYKLYVGFPNLSLVRMNGYTAYTGSIRVISDLIPNSSYMLNPEYTTYQFKCGLLLNTYSS